LSTVSKRTLISPQKEGIDITLDGAIGNAFNPLATPGFELPDGRYGSFSPTAGRHYYVVANDEGSQEETQPPEETRPLIVSNPVFTEFGNFTSSDDLINQLGLQTDNIQRRLGDGVYETRLVRDLVAQATGNRFLEPGFANDTEQYQWLMNNAAASQSDLNLTLGVALSAEQARQLTRDIVWLVEQPVAGKNVLVPVLYLAGDSKVLQHDGALIAGNTVELTAGGPLTNSGGIRASENLIVSAGHTLLNTGTLQGIETLEATAAGDLVNRGGHINGGRVTLNALTGDIIHETVIEQTHSDKQFRGASANIRTEIGDTASITADTLALNAGHNIEVTAAHIKTTDNLTAIAGENLIISSGELRSRAGAGGKKSHYLDDKIWNKASTIDVDGDANFNAGNVAAVQGSQISAEGDLTLQAENGVAIVSVQDSAEF
ncbi:hemagglutinin repeat-containing protein, partial [Parendozoicomonas sp. Alg238-R29]|uniref:hemagglutinin repeat-containing protein n=1 Tax=Parendozoicomonas sp. Alg238-R29 TaxID=2993446 RepID=UPI00248ECAC1